ncbi:MAG TPA: PAS domain S-box protein [Chthoniobacter sp.]|nr:PAS domain S-box protein [Chthoniobacter sp.]
MMSRPSEPSDPSRELEALRPEVTRLQEENARLRTQLEQLQRSSIAAEQGRRGALNLMEDAVAAEGRWRTSEEKYRTLFESIDEGFCLLELIWDAKEESIVDYRVQEANKVFERQMGIENARGKLASEIGLEADGDLLNAYGPALRRGQSRRVENFSRKTGRWYSVYVSRIGDESSRLVCAVFGDITERKQAEGRQAFLLKVSDALRPLVNPLEIEKTVCRLLGEYLAADRVAYCEILPSGQAVVTEGGWSRAGVQSIKGMYEGKDFGTFFEVMESGKVATIDDALAGSGLSPETYERTWGRIGLRAAISCPFFKQGHLAAIFYVHSLAPRHWSEIEIALVVELGERTWEALERARAEEALRKSEEKLRAVANVTPDLLWSSEATGETTWYNQRWLEYTGQSYEEAIGSGWTDAIHPDDREGSECRYREAVEQRRSLEQAHRLRGADGQYRWFLCRAEPLLDEQGRVVKMYGAAADIHELRETAEQLRVGEERFRVALHAAGMAAWDYDVVGNHVVWNEQHFRLLGLPMDQAPSDPEDFFRSVHPEDEARVREEMRRAIEETGVYRADFRIVRADTNEVRWMSGYGRAIQQGESRTERLTGVMIDITEQEESKARLAAAQERLRLVVESALEHAIVAMDKQRRVTSWNAGAERILGFTREEMMGQMADVIFTPEDRVAGVPAKESEGALTEGRANDNRWMQRKDGSRFWANGAMVPMRSRPDGEWVGFVKILRDETAMREAQLALEDSREQLWQALKENESARAEVEAASAAKDRFLAMLSHELRTPLMPILTATHVLERMPNLSEQVRETIRMIRRNLKIEAQFIDDLLDVTRITSSKFEIIREDVDVHEAVRQAVEVSEGDLHGKEMQLTVALEATRHHLMGDFARIQQAFWNLLKNSAKFTPKGGQIRVHSWNEGEDLFVAVTDTGIGIPEDALSKIFDAFTQASPEIPRKFGGLGLGLAIAKAAIDAHGGHIQVASAGPGAGATFTIRLPILPSQP